MQPDAEMDVEQDETQQEPSRTQPTTDPVPSGGGAKDDSTAAAKPKRKPKEPQTLEREPGKSVLPVSRVQRILKADKVRAVPSIRAINQAKAC